ncbi:MAG: hypothetical protein ACI9E1_002128 [Cryomorphaceae bacterium]|jgi:hypothetical protein
MEGIIKHSFLLRYKWLLLLGVFSCFGVCLYAVDFFELGPIHYSESNPNNAASELTKKQFKPKDNAYNDLDFLKSVLKELNVPEESQLLVYSKTSLQKKRIFPRYPRALYFSDSTYVGYVPGGDVEVITHDPKLGLVFYLINPEKANPDKAGSNPKFGYKVKRRKDCLSCHVSSRTRGVPGLFARSVVTDDQGEMDNKQASHFVDDETPLEHRWGGWYVTGNWSGISHMGNDFNGESKLEKLDSLKGRIEVSRYLKDTSDIAALLVLEHQCKIHTILVESKMQYQRSIHLENALRLIGSIDEKNSSSMRIAKRSAEEVVESLLFCNEAKIEGFGIEGNNEFEEAFIAQAKLSKAGKHLRKFRLYGRLFKYRCSYMIHSEAFLALPEVIKKLTFQRIHEILTAETAPKGYEHLKRKEKGTILEILLDTTAINDHLKK